jgi:hypothetical protein
VRGKVYELRRANEILTAASVFCDRARRRPTEVSRFIDEQRGHFGVEPICRTWACRRPLTTSARPASVPHERSRTSGCSSASGSCTRRTIAPTLPGAPGRRCDVRASRSAATPSSG